MSTETPKAPPGCEPIEGGAAYQITDGEAGLAHVEDDATERSGDGWSGTITCPACPVQIEGAVDGMRFYYRARWDTWTFGVGHTSDDAIRARHEDVRDGWSTGGEAEGDEGLAGSWMPHSEAWRHVIESIAAWRTRGAR